MKVVALTKKTHDPQCPHNAGVAVNTTEWTTRAADTGNDYPGLAAAMLANGDTVVIASGAPTPTTAIAAEFTTPCSLNSTFGDAGATRLEFPGQGVSITTVLPTADGGALIAGGTSQPLHSHWLIGKLTAGGQLDRGFGQDGWALLPWDYTATALAVTRAGDLVVGGDGNKNGSSSISELTAQGQLVTEFGRGGRSPMPGWHDGGVQGVWVEPNGNILSLVGGGNMGCWAVVAVTITPTGARVPGFIARFQRGLAQADPHAHSRYAYAVFTGDLTPGPNGFHLVGTAQDNCVDNPPSRKPNPTQRVTNIAFNYDGDLDTGFGSSGTTNFPAPIADGAWALPQADGSVLLVTIPDAVRVGLKQQAHLVAYSLTNTGEVDTTYGSHGATDIALPYKDDSDGAYDGSPLAVSNGEKAAVVADNARGDSVLLIAIPNR